MASPSSASSVSARFRPDRSPTMPCTWSEIPAGRVFSPYVNPRRPTRSRRAGRPWPPRAGGPLGRRR
ncbi:MAG: hypothetical protein ACK55I_48040, partial [bacterium]